MISRDLSNAVHIFRYHARKPIPKGVVLSSLFQGKGGPKDSWCGVHVLKRTVVPALLQNLKKHDVEDNSIALSLDSSERP